MSKRKMTQAILTPDGKVMIKNESGKLIEAKSKTEWNRLESMVDEDINYDDIPELDEDFFKKVARPWPPAKKQLTIRLDEDVLEWLKGQGKGYHTRINHILRIAMDHQKHA